MARQRSGIAKFRAGRRRLTTNRAVRSERIVPRLADPWRKTATRALAVLAIAVTASVGIVACSSDRRDATVSSPTDSADSAEMRSQRERLVDDVLSKVVSDARVLDAMRRVPRHRFVPENLLDRAYDDRALPIDQDQTISQPSIVARMTELADLEAGERVLEIGTGSGYQAAVLAEVGAEVYTVEIVPELAEKARETLGVLGYRNLRFRLGDGYDGWPDEAPFDAILVTAAPGEVPPPLVEQLAPGGRLVIPVGEQWQELLVLEKDAADGTVTRRSVRPVRFVPMTGQAQSGGDRVPAPSEEEDR